MAQTCFKSLWTHTQGRQGGQKTRQYVRNSKILIARLIIQKSKKLKTIKNASKYIKRMTKKKNRFQSEKQLLVVKKIHQFRIFFINGFWFNSMIGNFRFLTIFLIFWHSMDSGSGSTFAVFADNHSENEIWNRLKQFLPMCFGHQSLAA